MTRLLRRLAPMLLLWPVLVACSLTDEPLQSGVPSATASARPVAIQNGMAINGRLLFVQDGNLYLYQGQSTRQITNDRTTRSPVWAPDGSRIAYVRREESFSDIYLLDARGGVPTQVTFNKGASDPWTQAFMHEVVWATEPSWTRDGEALVFLSQIAPPAADPPSEYPLSIYRYALELVGQRQPTNDDLLVQEDGNDLQRPVWSPDDTALAYVRVPRDGSAKQIILYDPNTGVSQPYPGIPENTYDPAWSPDGQWLAFAGNIGGRTDIWVIPNPARGGSAIRLTNTGTARAPAWSPDGSQLAYIEVAPKSTDVLVMTLQRSGEAISAGPSTALTSNGHIDANSGLSWAR